MRSAKYLFSSWLEWYVIVPIRKVRNRIGCLFGRHFAWNPYFYVLPGATTMGPYTGVSYCVSCGKEKREPWADDLEKKVEGLHV